MDMRILASLAADIVTCINRGAADDVACIARVGAVMGNKSSVQRGMYTCECCKKS